MFDDMLFFFNLKHMQCAPKISVFEITFKGVQQFAIKCLSRQIQWISVSLFTTFL